MEVLSSLMQSMSVEDATECSQSSNLVVFAADVNQVHTDFVYGEFSQKLMIIATQYQKIGSLLKVTIDQVENCSTTAEPVYTVSVIFGADNIEQQAACRYLAEKLNIKKPLVCFLCLKSYDLVTVRELADAILSHPDIVKNSEQQ